MKTIAIIVAAVAFLPLTPLMSTSPHFARTVPTCFICQGCGAVPTEGDGNGTVVWETEPSFANGTCTGDPGHCVPTNCILTGTFKFKNNTGGKLWWSTGGGRNEIDAGASHTVEFGAPGSGTPIVCPRGGPGNSIIYTFYAQASGGGPIDGCYYNFTCSGCNG